MESYPKGRKPKNPTQIQYRIENEIAYYLILNLVILLTLAARIKTNQIAENLNVGKNFLKSRILQINWCDEYKDDKCSSCHAGYFLTDDSECVHCGLGCRSCKNDSGCLYCDPLGFYLQKNEESESICKSCFLGCTVCTSKTFCKQCQHFYVLNESKTECNISMWFVAALIGIPALFVLLICFLIIAVNCIFVKRKRRVNPVNSSSLVRGVSSEARAGVTTHRRLVDQGGAGNSVVQMTGNSETEHLSSIPRAFVVEPNMQNTANALPFGQQIEMVKPNKPQIVEKLAT